MKLNGDELTKRGYLKEKYRLFHLKDQRNAEFESHYHDFNKIIIFISGNVTYLIEGKAYRLKPWDILFINDKEMHKVLINSNEVYERLVLWIKTDFVEGQKSESNLLSCFGFLGKRQSNLVRPSLEKQGILKRIILELNNLNKDSGFGGDILHYSIFLQLMVYMNRFLIEEEKREDIAAIKYDSVIVDVLEYINSNLSQEITVDVIASKFFVSRYHLMHKFKEQTGYTVYNYILQKRLIMAATLLRCGGRPSQVCQQCGFRDYSSFVKSFKKFFNVAPNKYKNIN